MTYAPALSLLETQPLLRSSMRRERVRELVRLGVCSLVVVALPMVTEPGKIIADTKLDLAVAPVRFMARALTLWDPQQFGQLQNQAVGYLFPMGPFFALGRLATLPPWVVQRLWIGTVALAAFLGTVRLAGRLGAGTPRTRLIAGFAYALSPAGLTLLGTLSSEFLPAAMLPWILLPLVGVGRAAPPAHVRLIRRWPRHRFRKRARRPRLWQVAARSAVAVALCGGINGTATFAVLLPAFLAVLTLPRGAHRWRLLAWWAPAVFLVTCWWSVPLLLLGRYGVSVVPYTESAAATTSVTSLSDTLRGTENWVSYLVVNGQAWWQLGYRVATQTLPTLGTGLVAALGLSGLVSRDLPARRFLLCSVLLGVLVIAAGYVSPLGNPLAGQVDHLINGPASPLRNVRKFDPMIRLPVALGLAHMLASVRAPWPRTTRRDPPWARWRRAIPLAARPPGTSLNVVAIIAIAVLAIPGYLGGLANPGAFTTIPRYWAETANWLDTHAGHQAVLVEPGAPFSQYLWGSPLDDVLEPLSTVDWAERDLSLLGSPGNERLLDAVDTQLAAGQGSAGLAPVLARMGVKYVVVRNDLSRSVLAGAWPARVNEALSVSPGITKAAQFGPLVGSTGPEDATNLDEPFPAVEVYQVAGAQPAAVVQPAAGTLRVYGGPESLLTLASEQVLDGAPVLLNSDGPGLPVAGSVVTDSLRRRVRNFGELRSAYSPTMTAAQRARTFEAINDYTEPGWHTAQAVAEYHGIANVFASSSDAGIAAVPVQWASGLGPYSAVDGDPRTIWESGSWHGPLGQWLQVDFDAAVNPGVVNVAFVDDPVMGPPVTQVVVRTAAGRVTDPVRVTGRPQPLQVPWGPSRWLRLTVTRLAYPPHPVLGPQVGISEVAVPGVRASRTIMAPPVPALGASGPATVVLAKAQPQPSSCMRTLSQWVCDPALSKATEEQFGFDEGFTGSAPAAGAHAPGPARAPTAAGDRAASARAASAGTARSTGSARSLTAGSLTVTGRVRLRGSAVLTSPAFVAGYAAPGGAQPVVTASSAYAPDPQDQARSAFDGDPATTWIASPADEHPTLTVRWRGRKRVDEVTIQRPPGAPGLLQVLLEGSRGQVRGGTLGPAGVLRFAPMRTRSLTLVFTSDAAPVRVSDVVVSGVPELGVPPGEFRLRCGLGPRLNVNGQTVPTRAWGTFADLLAGRPLHFSVCGAVATVSGANRVAEPAGDPFDVQDVVLERAATPVDAAPQAGEGQPVAARVLTWTPSRRVLDVTARSRSYLEVNENFNAGWRADIDGRQLAPVRLDGWKQAWALPAGTSGAVTLTYLPDRPYHGVIALGLGAVLLTVLLAAWRPVRIRARARVRGGGGQRPPRTRVRLSWGARLALAGRGRVITAIRSRTRLGKPLPLPYVGAVVRWVVVAAGLLSAGVWLGGYPGAVIVTVACAVFLAAAHSAGHGRGPRWLCQPQLLAGVLLAGFACAAVGEHLALIQGSPRLVTLLAGTVPQVVCLIAVARLAAALLRDRPHGAIRPGRNVPPPGTGQTVGQHLD